MGIGVYRIYVSYAWGQGPALAKLVAALDANTAFLYRMDRLLPEDMIASLGSDNDELGAIRVAMTQSHVMLTPVASPPNDDPATATGSADIFVVERNLASSGFRRRIPILGVRLEAGVDGDDQKGPPIASVDRIVELAPSELACAIQELAEEAAAERRQANAIALARPVRDARPDRNATQPASRVASETLAARAIPVGEIMEAYHRLVATRTIPKPSQ